MKKITFFSIICFAISNLSIAQTVGVGTTTPHPSALLEIRSTNKGLLIPRLDTSQINGMVNPTSGLIVYCTTYKKPVYRDSTDWCFFDGSRMNPFTVGEYWGGGVVFYVDATGRHGFLVATSDLYTGVNSEWGYAGNNTVYSTTVGSGFSNTLLNSRENDLYGGGLNYTIADACNDLDLNGFNDWFLPSKDELYLLFLNRGVLNDYDNLSGTYWSSSRVLDQQTSTLRVWVQDINGNTSASQRMVSLNGLVYNCRPIRAF